MSMDYDALARDAWKMFKDRNLVGPMVAGFWQGLALRDMLPDDIPAIDRDLFAKALWREIERDGVQAYNAWVTANPHTADTLPSDHTDALLSLARSGDATTFRELACALGVASESVNEMWSGARRRLGLDVE